MIEKRDLRMKGEEKEIMNSNSPTHITNKTLN